MADFMWQRLLGLGEIGQGVLRLIVGRRTPKLALEIARRKARRRGLATSSRRDEGGESNG